MSPQGLINGNLAMSSNHSSPYTKDTNKQTNKKTKECICGAPSEQTDVGWEFLIESPEHSACPYI